MKLALPPVLTEALKRIAQLEFHPFRLWRITYNRPNLYRLMRCERRRNLLAVAIVLITHMDIPTGRIVRLVDEVNGERIYADCSLSWIAETANVSLRTLCRVLVDLESVGWINRQPQKMLPGPDYGTLAVASVIRTITDNFFRALGLTKILSRDRAFFKQERRGRIFKQLCKIVSRSVKFRQINKKSKRQEFIEWCHKNCEQLPIGYG